MQRPNSIQSSIALGNIAVKRSDPRWYELTLANTIYGGAFNSRIVRNIREEKGYTYSPQSALTGFADAGLLPVRRRRPQRSDRRDADRGVQGDRQDARRRQRRRGAAGREAYLRGIFPIQTATQTGLAQRR